MSKKNRTPSWLKTFKKPKGRQVPTEVLTIPGMGTITKAGRFVQLDSHRTPAEQAALMQRLAATHDGVVARIQESVDACAAIVPNHDPLDLMHHAYTDFFRGMLGIESEHEVGHEQSIDMRTLEYVQTLIVSLPNKGLNKPVTKEIWDELCGHIETMYRALTLEWPIADTTRQSVAGTLDRELAEFRVPLLVEWLSVRGNRYPIHEREWFSRMLAPHDAALTRVFGVNGEQIAAGIFEAQRRLSVELGRSMKTVMEIHKATFTDENINAVAAKDFDSERDYLLALVDQTGRADELQQALGRAFGTALFDVTDVFPRALLERIALAPGGDEKFFQEGEHRGWPLRTPPTRSRPVLRVADKFYIFDVYSNDYLYRAIERALKELEPSYRREHEDLWNKGQKQISESLPVELLVAMLPGARVFRDIEYPVQREPNGKVEWCECDAVVAIDSLLVAVEVKGGRASDSSPLEDMKGHLRNVKKLLVDPADQARRLINYVSQAPEVALFSRGDHREVGRLRGADFDLLAPCAVSVDSVAAVSGSFQHSPYATNVAPTWCVSIDELMAYRDVLRGPTWLYAFLRHRLRAFELPALGHLSELDHLGAFFEHNDYPTWAEQTGANSVSLFGYREKLDRYFNHAWVNDGVFSEVPHQAVSPIISQVIAAFEQARPPGFLQAGASLLNFCGSARTNIAASIQTAAQTAVRSGCCRILTVGSSETQPFYIALTAQRHAGAERRTYRDGVLGRMFLAGAETAQLMELHVADDFSIASAGCELLAMSQLSDAERGRLPILASQVGEMRVASVRDERVKLGRNDACLCGSGSKYKKCCLRGSRGL